MSLKKVFLLVSIATISTFLQKWTIWRHNYGTSQPKIGQCVSESPNIINSIQFQHAQLICICLYQHAYPSFPAYSLYLHCRKISWLVIFSKRNVFAMPLNRPLHCEVLLLQYALDDLDSSSKGAWKLQIDLLTILTCGTTRMGH